MFKSSKDVPTILCFVQYYFPAYRAGGPIRSIKNMIDVLGDEINFLVVTRDRDLGDAKPYNSIEANRWNKVGKANVFYASPGLSMPLVLLRIIRETKCDTLYLNSFFSPFFSILPLLVVFLLSLNVKIILAPRGEFSPGALNLKKLKKIIYLFVYRRMLGYKNIIYHSTSDIESDCIKHILGDVIQKSASEIVFASPLLNRYNIQYLNNKSNVFRACFVSRISPMKNLDFLLRAMMLVDNKFELHIYGPKEDVVYFDYCRKLVNLLPDNLKVFINGELEHSTVIRVLASFDLFMLPSRGENFGHIIFEALSAGTPALISDKTPWVSDVNGGLEVLKLDEEIWANAIEGWINLSDESLLKRRHAALAYVSYYMSKDLSVEETRNLFVIH